MVTAGAAGVLAAPLAARAQASASGKAPLIPPSLDELLGDPDVLDVSLSPDGRRLAVLRQLTKDGEHSAFILLSRVDDIAAPPAAVALGDREVDRVRWGDNHRLLVWMTFRKDEHGLYNGVYVNQVFVPVPVRRVMSIDLDGKNPIILFGQTRSVIQHAFDTSRVVDLLTDQPGHVLMQVWDDRHNAFGLHKVDINTGATTPVEYGVPETDTWLTQNGVPVLRLDSNSRGTVGSIFGRPPGETHWKLIRRSRLNELRKLPDFDIVGMTPQAGVVLVATRAEGRDATVIRNFDLTTFAFGEVVAEQAGHDMDGALVDQNHQLVASAFYDERQDYAFADPSFAAHFRGVNSYFHNQCNVEVFDVDASHSRFVFKVTGPRDPGSYHLYHRDGSRLEAIGDRLPKLSPDRLAPSEVHKIKVRDGAEITAYLTVPMGADPGRPLPMVVFPHGGPELRDKLEFDPFTQAMAARGWLVLQPNFRGSSGYGKSFADQGRRHWGDRMQEDVEDCVSLLVARGRADPQRLAICGASYGGYAALMGAVRQPRRYKAIVSIAGPSDLVTFLADARHDDGVDSPAYAYWTATIGDLKADLAMLTTASPARRAAEVQAPVLLIHGTRDNVVDPEQSKIMAKALKDAGKPCQYVELPGASHNGWTLKTTRTVIGSAVDFIAQHL